MLPTFSADIKICTVNCKGLGDYRKRKDVFNYLKGLDCHLYIFMGESENEG